MPDSKNAKWLDDYTDQQSPDQDQDPKVAPDQSAANVAPDQSAANVAPDQPAANDADGWQQYRRWISKAPTPKSKRSGIDPALFTWKGYRSWTEQVRRNWDDESSGDSD